MARRQEPGAAPDCVHTICNAIQQNVYITMLTKHSVPLTIVNKLIFVMVKSAVFFAVRTEFLNIIYRSFGFKGLMLKITGTHINMNTGSYT
jgi:hypothetical protein